MTKAGYSNDPVTPDFDTVWEKFVSRYPTEESCLDQIYRLILGGTIECLYCEGADIYKNDSGRVLTCGDCRRQTRPTAGTFFHGIKYARPWLALIWLSGHGVTINSWQFHKLVGIAYSSALNIFKKLTLVIESQMAQDFQSAPSALFDLLICRRSLETPRRKHPREEGDANEEQSVVDQLQDPTPQTGAGTSRSAPTDWFGFGTMGNDEPQNAEMDVLAILSTKPFQLDVLSQQTGMPASALSATLTMLEISGLVTRMPGDWYVRCGSAAGSPGSTRSNGDLYDLSFETTNLVEQIVAFVRNAFHGISRKYLQLYVAAHWCLTDRKQWGYGTLLNSCMKFRRLHYRDILAYVSPPLIRISPGQS